MANPLIKRHYNVFTIDPKPILAVPFPHLQPEPSQKEFSATTNKTTSGTGKKSFFSTVMGLVIRAVEKNLSLTITLCYT